MNFLSTVFFGVQREGFLKGLQGALDHIGTKDGIYTGDNLVTWGRNLGFFENDKFMQAWRTHGTTSVEEAIVWRIYVVNWAVQSVLARNIPGDLVECACYKGTTARIVCDYVDWAQRPERHYYLYDLFDHDPSMPHHRMTEHSAQLYSQVKARFAEFGNVTVTQGKVPEVLHDVGPKEKIAFMHIDLNNVQAEIGALEVLFDKLQPGGIMILDDYGWLAYRPQKLAEDPWLAKRGYHVLEMPTGQGLVFK
jgi:O-methyltransferase